MGSATTQATAAATTALAGVSAVDIAIARELFAASRVIGDSSQLSGALADASAPPIARANVVAAVFGGSFQAPTVALLTTVATQRWSSASDLVDGIEELAVRAASISEPAADVEGDLFRFSRVIADNPELELALGSRLGDESAKGALVQSLLGDRASASATLIASSLVQQLRDRRVRRLLARAMDLVSDQRGRTVATVVTAVPLSAAQQDRLAGVLASRYGTTVSFNNVIDPNVVGGLRVQIADEVIDASVSARLADLRHRLAG